MDTIPKEQRSSLMSRIGSKNTKPEMTVRSLLHRLGYRFRLHRKDLPGKPDIVLPKHRKVVFVQGCFWHGHTCRLASKPKSNSDYWQAKIHKNRLRDVQNISALVQQGWSVLEVWECEVRKMDGLAEKLQFFLGKY